VGRFLDRFDGMSFVASEADVDEDSDGKIAQSLASEARPCVVQPNLQWHHNNMKVTLVMVELFQ
jgi:hypothetical protein